MPRIDDNSTIGMINMTANGDDWYNMFSTPLRTRDGELRDVHGLLESGQSRSGWCITSATATCGADGALGTLNLPTEGA